MRRFASVFVSKRDRQAAPRLDIAVPPPQDHSSASSSASASLSIQTPDDDHPLPIPSLPTSPPSKSSWKSWLTPKRSFKKHSSHHPAQTPHEDPYADDNVNDKLPLPPSPPVLARVSPVPSPPAVALKNLTLTVASKVHAPPPSLGPFVTRSPGPLFPRSCNPPSPPSPSLRSNLLNTRLLRCLDDPATASTLSAHPSILPFASIPPPNSVITPLALSPCDIQYPSKSSQIHHSSPGLRSWIARPCFEDRFVIYIPAQDGHILRSPVTSANAVAALEYSDSLDVMVNPDFDSSISSYPPASHLVFQQPQLTADPTLDLDPTPLSIPVQPAQSQAPAPQRSMSYTAVPSPLRMEQTASPPGSAAPASPPPAAAPSVKRIVRFAEDDDDDGTPLHILRMRRKREEKANFLRREQLRRTAEQDKARKLREEDERRFRDERDQMRQEREQERKEKERRLFAEEVTAARLRREAQRTGGVPSNVINPSALLSPSSSSASVIEPERNRARDSKRLSKQPTRREVSDSALLTISTSPAHIHGSASGSSRPPSGSPSPPSGNNHSRPPSTYSIHTQSSSEDLRRHEGSKRSSLAASATGSFQRPYPDRSWSMPTWGGSTPALQFVPPVPPVPHFIAMQDNMPLLPPTAPFMMMQYPRQSRNASPGPSTSSGSRKASSSSERDVQRQKQQQDKRRQPSSSPHSHSQSPHRPPAHHRHSSGDMSLRSDRAHPPSASTRMASSQSAQSLPRGRPPQPHQYMQVPNPWTALPTQTGLPPMYMPYTQSTPQRNNSEEFNNRKSTFS